MHLQSQRVRYLLSSRSPPQFLVLQVGCIRDPTSACAYLEANIPCVDRFSRQIIMTLVNFLWHRYAALHSRIIGPKQHATQMVPCTPVPCCVFQVLL